LVLQAELSAKIVSTLSDKLDRIRREQRDRATAAGPVDIAMTAFAGLGQVVEQAITMPGDLIARLIGGTDP
jgi:hypothetical protein